jgi:hypothetical protein
MPSVTNANPLWRVDKKMRSPRKEMNCAVLAQRRTKSGELGYLQIARRFFRGFVRTSLFPARP